MSVSDVRRVAAGVRAGKDREQVFPRLSQVAASVAGDGLTVEVRFVKHDGLPVKFTQADAVDAAAIRVVDLQRKYHRSPTDLAAAVALSRPKAGALRAHLGIDEDDNCRHVFTFSSQRHVRYSDNAYTRMRDALEHDELDMTRIWAAHGNGRHRGPRPQCDQPGCVFLISKEAA